MDADMPPVEPVCSDADQGGQTEQKLTDMSSLEVRLREMCESDDLTDVEVVLVNNDEQTIGTFRMHRVFAAKASPVLSKMFDEAEMKAQKVRASVDANEDFLVLAKDVPISITLMDMLSSTFLQLKWYMYTNQIPIIGESCILKDILELHRKGNVLQVAGLAKSISSTVVRDVDKANAVEILNHGCRWDDTELIEKTLQVIAENGQYFLNSPDFLELDEKSLNRVLQRDDLEIETEAKLFEAVKKWGIHKCTNKNLDPEAKGVLQGELTNVVGFQ